MGEGESTRTVTTHRATDRGSRSRPEAGPLALPDDFVPTVLFSESRATLNLRRDNGKTGPPILIEEHGIHLTGLSGGREISVIQEGPATDPILKRIGSTGGSVPGVSGEVTGETDRVLRWADPITRAFDTWEEECARSGLPILDRVFEANVGHSSLRTLRPGGAESAALRGIIEGRILLTLEPDGRPVTLEGSRWIPASDPPEEGAPPLWKGAAAAVARRALRMKGATTIAAMRAPALFSPAAAGVLIHEICGHLLEADLILAGASPFTGALGSRIAPVHVTLRDQPTLVAARVHLEADDEGDPTGETTLIQSGILRGFISDRRHARATGGVSTGNARRESYRHPALPRMTNLLLEPGDESPEDLLKGIGRGILVERLGRGQVDPRRGEFRLEVESGSLILEGRVDRPLAGAFIVGSCRDLLARIDAVGSDLRMDVEAGVCIKEDQIVPVGQAAPSVRVSRVAVVPGSAP